MDSTPITENKSTYKVRNWKEYNASLCQRGSLTIWLSDEVLAQWSSIDVSKKVVGEPTYLDIIIQCCLLLKISYRLKFRQTTGFVTSLFYLLRLNHLPVPDYTTLCRRQHLLLVEISNRLSSGENLSVGIDSTGLKVYGEGEWKVRKHGVSKRRTWRKLHICIDLVTQEILSVELTGNNEDDASVGKSILKGKTSRISRFSGDGAYDDFDFREILGSSISQIIPPPKNAVIKKGTKKKPLPDYIKQRNEAVEAIKKDGSKRWKEESGYHRRSLNEVVMFRYKTIFGGSLSARKVENQITEAKLKCFILNKFTGIGMPDSYRVS